METLRRNFTSIPPLAFATARATDEQTRAAFDALDGDGDGLLSREEVDSYLDKMGYGTDERARFFARTDADADGALTYEEFKLGWTFISTFSIANHTEGEVVRKPGAVRGMDLVIEKSSGCTIMICDHSSQVLIDGLDDCRVLIGPCAGSVFARRCTNCTIAVATRQLRTRGCERCTFHLYCATEPVIEASMAVQFAPFNASYPQLKKHFVDAALEPTANLWWAVYDFNEAEAVAEGAPHWSELPEGEWSPWIVPLQGAEGADLGPPENPVPRDARAPLPKDSMRGMAMGGPPPGMGAPPGMQRQGSRSCTVL